MAGTFNDTVYASNFDFSGQTHPAPTMLLDGQLLIGSTALNAGGTHCNINTLTAGTGISITNGPGTIIITNTGGGGGGGGTETLMGNSGSATEAGGVISVVGSTGITTSGSGSQLTISPANDLAALEALTGTGYAVRTGNETWALRTFQAGSGITLTNADGVAGNTTITAGATVPTTFTEDSGTATPAANNINILGTSAQGISTSGSGSTVTITASNASAVQKGVASFNSSEFTVTAGAVASNAITVTAGTGLTTGGSVNLGGSVTLALDIPVTVAHGGTGDTTLTAHGVLIGEGTSAVNVTAAGTNGQVLVGGTGVDPAFATVGGTQGVTITGGSNTISIGLVNVPNSALANSSITVNAGSGISVSGSPVSLGGAVTISASGTIATQFSADSGVATPSGNDINLLGTASQGISTSASGNTVTFTVANATTTTKGVASFNTSDFTVSSGAVSLNGSGVGKTITGDSGGALSPTAGNWNIIGQQAGTTPVMDTVGSGSTLSIEDRSWLTPLVVDPSTSVGTRGTFSTIASALAAAVSGQTIFIRPGTYTENLTLVAGVTLTSFSGNQLNPLVTIVGKATFTGAGTVTISNISLETNGDFFLVVSGSSASIVNLQHCYLNCNDNTGISFTSSSSSSQINVYRSNGNLNTTGIAYLASSSSGAILFEYCSLDNTGSSSTASTISAGSLSIHFSRFNNTITTSGTASFAMRHCRMLLGNKTCLNLNSTNASAQSQQCVLSHLQSGNQVTFTVGDSSTFYLINCDILCSNTNFSTGTGTLNYTPIAFEIGNTSTSTVTTQNVQPFGPVIALMSGPQILGGAGSPNGSVTATKGSIWLRTNGTTTNNRAYINTDGGTTWTAITTVA